MDRVIDDLAVQGYKISNRGESSALLEKSDNGSVGVHVVLLLFTAGIGNIIYWAVKHSGRDRVAIKLEEDSSALPPPQA
jgi:hypothetical protein